MLMKKKYLYLQNAWKNYMWINENLIISFTYIRVEPIFNKHTGYFIVSYVEIFTQ